MVHLSRQYMRIDNHIVVLLSRVAADFFVMARKVRIIKDNLVGMT